jgi:hypothetical protein
MLKASARFLQVVVVLIGSGVLAGLLWVPPHEGRNAHATLFATYFKDPFLAYAYLGSIPFFFALCQAFKVLEDSGRNEIFMPRTVKALRTIRYCALATAGLVAGGVAYIIMTAGGTEDTAGGVMPGIFAAFVSMVAAAAAAVLENIIQSAMGIKSDSGGRSADA